jgi:NADP-dependent aldehyde dehydrogenase
VRLLAGETKPIADPAATTVPDLLADADPMTQECFGPAALVVTYESEEELLAAAWVFDGQLTATIHGSVQEPVVPELLDILAEHVGRVVWNGWPDRRLGNLRPTSRRTVSGNHGGPDDICRDRGDRSVSTASDLPGRSG